MVIGLPFINSPKEVYEACVLGKRHKDFFFLKKKKKSWRVRKLLELINSNL